MIWMCLLTVLLAVVPPCEARSTAGQASPELKTIEANGLRFAYLEMGSGPLVLLLHGFPDTADTWRHTMAHLAAAGYRAVAPFTRGYDPTDIPDDGDYSVLALANDAIALIEALGASEAVVVGHDWGASTAYTAAVMRPDLVRKLVTVAIPPPRLIEPNLGLLWRAPHFVLFQFGSLSEWYVSRNDFAYVDYLYSYWSPNGQWTPEDTAAVKQGFAKEGRLAAALGYYRQLAADARNDLRQQLYRSEIAVPTLVFAGDADILDVSVYDRLGEAIKAPHRLHVVRGAGHFLHREAPDEFADKLIAFLGQPRFARVRNETRTSIWE